MAMETVEGTVGVGHPPKHSTEAAAATTENGMHPRREYNKVVSEALVGGQASAGPALEEDGHGAHNTAQGSSGRRGGTKNTRGRAWSGNRPTERWRRGLPPNGCAHLTRAAAEGGKREGDPPPSSARP